MRRMIVFSVVALVLGAGSALATVRHDPVRIRLVGPPRAAEAGRAFAGELEITAAGAGQLQGLRSTGPGWATGKLMTGPAMALEAGRPLRIPFEVTAVDPSKPLTLEAEVGGRVVKRSFDLSAASVERRLRPGRAVVIPASMTEPDRPLDRPAHRSAGPAADDPGEFHPEPADDPAIDAGPQETVAARDIRVRGRFEYVRHDGVTMGADNITVHVRDSDTGPDDELATVQTDAYGYFDVWFTWDQCCEGNPDLYVEFEAKNGEVEIEDATWEVNYRWATPTYGGFGGSLLEVGPLRPADESEFPAVHQLTSVTRAWRWYYSTEGLDSHDIDVQWPDDWWPMGSGAYYNDFFEEIHISGGGDVQNSDWVPAHEYGHHFMHHHATSPDPDYCNGTCDSGGCSLFDDGGHCEWCAELGSIAWTEGVPNWLATVQCKSYEVAYGTPASSVQLLAYEEVLPCTEPPYTWSDSWRTEGMLAAFLWDIFDVANEHDGNGFSIQKDQLALGSHPIMLVVTQDGVDTPAEFGFALKARYPGYQEKIWETARNCRYEFDIAAPGAVTMLSSTSHTIGAASPDATIDLWWQRPADDWSGAGGYSVLVASSPMLPDAVAEMGAGETFKTAPVAPGTWYVSVRAMDHVGHWSATYASVGPFTIEVPSGANLAWVNHAGWFQPIVPRGTADATLSSCPKPTSLPGPQGRTYYSFHGMNTGGSAASTHGGYRVNVRLDGASRFVQTIPSTGPGESVYQLNLGPLSPYRGRHTLSALIDDLERVMETNESDNVYGRQYCWNATSPGSTEPRSSDPPTRAGGWEEVTTGSILPNCRGFLLDDSGAWDAIVVNPGDDVSDHDAELFFHTTSVDTGFAVPRAISDRPEGCVDFVLVNRHTLPGASWDVGIVDINDSGTLGTLEYVPSKPFAFGDSIVVGLGPGHMMELFEVNVPSGSAGPEAVIAKILSGHGPLQLAWFDRMFTRGGLPDHDGMTWVEDGVQVVFPILAPATGVYALALYRDPRDGQDSVTVSLKVRAAPPDYHPYALAGWYAPMVPRPAADGTWGSCGLPDTLYGDVESTYLNYGIFNDGGRVAPAMAGDTRLDGQSAGIFTTSTIGAFSAWARNDGIPRTVRAGRHTLGLVCDRLDAVMEVVEDNNRCAEQWVWGPTALAFDVPVTRAFPPDPMGGWDALPTGERWYNCDGVRTPLLRSDEGVFHAVAAMPGAASDVGVRLHVPADGAKTGFQSSLAISSWGIGQSEYVLVKMAQLSPRRFDVGVVGGAGTPQDYTIEAVRSTYEGPYPNGAFGPFTLGVGHILRLHDFSLPTGRHVFRLDNLSGTVDWGFTLHPTDSVYQSKGNGMPLLAEWSGGAGEGEQIELDVPAYGRYCLAVWKTGTADLPKSGSYRLDVRPLTVTAEQETPARTALSSIQPNPFSTRSTIHFDLAQEGEVTLEIYDVRGARMRSLSDRRWPAGRHRCDWDGADGSGRRVPPGMYVLRFAAGGATATRKLVRLE